MEIIFIFSVLFFFILEFFYYHLFSMYSILNVYPTYLRSTYFKYFIFHIINHLLHPVLTAFYNYNSSINSFNLNISSYFSFLRFILGSIYSLMISI